MALQQGWIQASIYAWATTCKLLFYFLFSFFWLHWAFSSCSLWAWLLQGMWNLSGARIELKFPVLAGGFLTTGPPGTTKNLEASQPCDRKTRTYSEVLNRSHYVPEVRGRNLSLHLLKSSVPPKQLLHVSGLCCLTKDLLAVTPQNAVSLCYHTHMPKEPRSSHTRASPPEHSYLYVI